MNDQIQSTIEVLAAKVRTKEEEANKLKMLVNELCAEEGMPARYESILDPSSGGGMTIRRDQFYGQPLTGAARSYLEMRRAANLGAASVNEIHKAIRDGGYKFETRDEEMAKASVRSTLRKTSSVFHRLPNGDYGLLIWYPGAKPQKDEVERNGAGGQSKHKGKSKKKEAGPEPKAEATGAPGNTISMDEIRDVVFKLEGNFTAMDVENAVKQAAPGKGARPGAIATTIWNLKQKGFLRMVSQRQGKKGAIYCKA